MEFDLKTWAKLYQTEPPLTTETPHSATRELSQLALEDLPRALALWQSIDQATVQQFQHYLPQIQRLQQPILESAYTARVFLVGCGSSGRLAYWMQAYLRETHPNLKIIALLAGGTGALIRSQEGIEDSLTQGENALKPYQLTAHDYVIGLAASGRTPYVLGALTAAVHAQSGALLMLNNPLHQVKPRLKNPELLDQIQTLVLDVGPMALTGSTRLQATTALQLALLVLLDPDFDFVHFQTFFNTLDFQALAPLIRYESEILNQPGFPVLKNPLEYQSDPICLLTVLADLTERAPTFNLPPITPTPSASPWQIKTKNQADMAQLSQLATFTLPEAPTPYQLKIQIDFIDPLSQAALPAIQRFSNQACLSLPNTLPLAYSQLALKCLLNAHSTLTLGRLGYFSGNQMTHLSPSNAKLIDRAIRYALAYAPQGMTYESAAQIALSLIQTPSTGTSIVERLTAALCEASLCSPSR